LMTISADEMQDKQRGLNYFFRTNAGSSSFPRTA